MNKNLETIRRACIAANPDIMELKFGCKVVYKGLLTKVVTSIIDNINGKDEVVEIEIKNVYGLSKVKVEEVEILGRPIRLADVLYAIDMPIRWSASGIPTVKVELAKIISLWNLKNDDLNNNPQCWDFIAGILK